MRGRAGRPASENKSNDSGEQQEWASAQYRQCMRGNGWRMLNVLELHPIRE